MKFIKAAIFLCVAMSTFAQNKTSIGKRIQLRAVDLSLSSHHMGWQQMTQSEFRTLYGSELPTLQGTLQDDFYGIMFYGGRGFYNSMSSVNLGVWMDIKGRDGQKMWGNPSIRFGLSYMNRSDIFLHQASESRFPYDTVYTSYQGQTSTILIDSVNSQYLSQRFASNRLRMSMELLWRTSEFGRFTFYAGFGIGAGFSLKSSLGYSHIDNSYISPSLINQSYSNLLGSGEKRGPSTFEFRMSAVLGTEMSLGKSGIWERSCLYYEFAPTIMMSKTSGLASQNRVGFSHTLGLRFKF
jgi:hypothetical protein